MLFICYKVNFINKVTFHCKTCVKMLTLALKIYIKMDVSVVATIFFSLRMLIKNGVQDVI